MCRRLVGLTLIAMAGSAPATEVEDLRVWAGPEKTRAVLDLSATTEYRLFQLSDPLRVVIDLRNAKLRGKLDLPADRDHGVLRRVRHGVRDGADLRVVLDLREAVRPQSFLLQPAGRYGHRLVLDLKPRETDPQRQPVHTAPRGHARDVVIAIDAGHGGEDPGAVGRNGTHEKRVTLAVARELDRRLDAMRGFRGELIRDGDYYIALKDRFNKARAMRADLFVSIHADSFYDQRARGSSVYVLSRSGASSEAARWIAAEENEADRIGGVELQGKDPVLAEVLYDLAQGASLDASNNVAGAILDSLKDVGRVHKSSVEHANFVVLRAPDVPSVLVETAFISNPVEERKLNSPGHRRDLAAAMASGIREHFRAMPPQGTWIAANRDGSEYRVSRGDTLSDIADRYQVSVNALRRANDLDSDIIRVGRVLVIPTG